MSDPHDWMWSEALRMLDRAERMHQQLFLPAGHREAQAAAWAPPVDVLETEREVLVISGVRVLPPELRTAVIHRLELPQGRFERRVPLPPGHYESVRRDEADGCLVITLTKAAPTKAAGPKAVTHE